MFHNNFFCFKFCFRQKAKKIVQEIFSHPTLVSTHFIKCIQTTTTNSLRMHFIMAYTLKLHVFVFLSQQPTYSLKILIENPVFPLLRRIINCALKRIPDMSYLSTGTILNMV